MNERIFESTIVEKLYVEHAGVEHHFFTDSHKYIIIAYIAYGSGTASVDGSNFDIKPGDIFIINPSVPAEFVKTGSLLEIHYVFFEKSFLRGEWEKWENEFINLETFFKNTGKKYIKTADSEAHEIRNCIVRLINEYYEDAKGKKSVLFGHMLIILPLIFRFGVTKDKHIFSKNMLVDQTIRQIRNTIYSNPKPSEIAAHRFVSREHLGRIFKKETGMTLTQYTNKLRVEITKDILRNTDRPIEEIHIALNIDTKYLQKIFRQNTGMSMREYRSNYHYR